VTVGILGGGQLGRMLALAGYPLGLRFRFLDDGPDAPAGHLAELHVGGYEDPEALARFADGIDVATYEFENVPVTSAEWLATRVPVYPPPAALEVSQDRLTEKRFFESHGIPTPPFAPVQTRAELYRAIAALGLPAVLKTRRFGYDGKGQVVLRAVEDVEAAWEALGSQPLILEGFVPFQREVSLLGVRGRDGGMTFYPLVENHHSGGILRVTRAPAPDVSPALQNAAEGHVGRLMQALRYVGVLAVEFFQVGDRLIASEMAPRVHNSGHWTIEGAETSQFENHLRAILGLPLGSTALVGASVMLNLIGTFPPIAEMLRVPGAHVHLYGKEPRPGRKVGHVTVRHTDAAIIERSVERLQRLIADAPSSEEETAGAANSGGLSGAA
jgi:5-(carboxyamino)imidazole ribonucleotide synthase